MNGLGVPDWQQGSENCGRATSSLAAAAALEASVRYRAERLSNSYMYPTRTGPIGVAASAACPDPSGPVRTRLIRPSPSGPSGPSGPSVQHPTGVQSGHRHRSEPYTNTNIAESSKKAVFPWLFLTVPEPSSQNRGSALVLGPFLVPARWFGTAHPLPLYNHHQGQNGGGA